MEKRDWHNLSVKETAEILQSNPKQGLSEERVKELQRDFGKNELPEEKPLSMAKILFDQIKSPLIYILILAGLITLGLKEWTDSIIIFGAIIVNTAVGFFQENKASKTLAELKKIVKHKARVQREGNLKIIDSKELVPGDIFILRPGDKAPADARIIESDNLKVNEAALTGEWMPAEKNQKILAKETPLAERDNMVYMGTIIEHGKAKAIVVQTGIFTEIGKVAVLVRQAQEEKTPYQKKLSRFSKKIGLIIAFFSFAIFCEGILTGNSFTEMFTTSVAVAVAAIPEGLPVAMTVILALGMQRILKKRGLVRKLVAAETLGSVSIIFSDKTGTLTEAKMQVAGVYTATKEILSDGKSYKEEIDKNSSASYVKALKIGTLASEAFIENPDQPLEKWIIRGRPTERAILLAGVQAGFSKKGLEAEQPKIGEILFGPVHKYSASLNKISEKDAALNVLGAPEIILEKSEFLYLDGRIKKISDKERKGLNEKCEMLANQGQRILGVGFKKIGLKKARQAKDLKDTARDLVFVGFIALHDPLRKDAKRSIKQCEKAGIRPIIVTGDHKLTAKAIALKLGIPAKERNIIEGEQLKKLSDKEFKERLKDISVYARVEPEQKMRIISAWQEIGEVVAMTGDGINDAPALKKADIGVALGSGTEVAKETSDLILLPDNFSIIVSAIEEGRAIIDNIRKVITYLLTDSFTEIILISVSLFLGLPLPVSAAQILWVNLIEDGLPDIALTFEPKEKGLMKRKPQSKDAPLLTKEMKVIIFIIGIITDLMLLGLFFWLFKKLGKAEIDHIRTMVFATLAMDSLFYAFSCRSLRKNLWHIGFLSNKFLIYALVIGVLMLVFAVYNPWAQGLLGTVSLNASDWLIVLALAVAEIGLIEAAKYYFISKKQTEK